jgi:hypothetical protein
MLAGGRNRGYSVKVAHEKVPTGTGPTYRFRAKYNPSPIGTKLAETRVSPAIF